MIRFSRHKAQFVFEKKHPLQFVVIGAQPLYGTSNNWHIAQLAHPLTAHRPKTPQLPVHRSDFDWKSY